MNTMKPCRAIFLTLTVLMLVAAGCATHYQPPTDSAGGVASLEAVTPAWVVAIDGKKVSNGLAGVKRFSLLPGPHLITVHYNELRTGYVAVKVRGGPTQRIPAHSQLHSGDVPLELVVEAGHSYYLHPGAEETTWHPHINEIRDPVFQDIRPDFRPR